jgi:NADPH:quinone reductase-like Zn-dependent oxidoreductase
LNPGGIYAMLGGPIPRIFQMMILGKLTSLLGNKKINLMILKQNKYVDFYLELFEAGKVAPLIDKTYPMSETAEAFRYFGKSLQCGKIVIKVKDAAG